MNIYKHNNIYGGRGGIVTGRRYFTTLDGSSQFYTVPTVTLSGDFEIEFDFSTTADLTTLDAIGGNSASTDNRILMTASTNLQIKIDGGSLNYTVSAMDDGKLHNVKFVRNSSNDIECFFDGVSVGTQNRVGNFVLEELGRYNTGSYFDGVIANVKITDGSTVVVDTPLNENFATTSTVNNSGTLGNGTAIGSPTSELFTLINGNWEGVETLQDTNFNNALDWSVLGNPIIGSGIATISGDGTSGNRFYQIGVLVEGYKYIRRYEILTNTAVGSTSPNRIYDSYNAIDLEDGVGANSDLFQCTDASGRTTIRTRAVFTSGDIVFNYLSVKRILELT